MRKLQLAYIMAQIHFIGIETGCDPTILAALATIESSLDPGAVGDGLQSHGMFQFHKAGAGAHHPTTKLHHIGYSIRAAANHVLELMPAVNDDLEDMASAYNQGLGGWQQHGRQVNQGYVDAFIAEYHQFEAKTPLEWAGQYLVEALGEG